MVHGGLLRAKTAAEGGKGRPRTGSGAGAEAARARFPAPAWSALCQSHGHGVALRTRLGWFPRVGGTVPRCRISGWDLTGCGCHTAGCINVLGVCNPVTTPGSCSSYIKPKCCVLSWHKSHPTTCSQTDLYQVEIWYCKFSSVSDYLTPKHQLSLEEHLSGYQNSHSKI